MHGASNSAPGQQSPPPSRRGGPSTGTTRVKARAVAHTPPTPPAPGLPLSPPPKPLHRSSLQPISEPEELAADLQSRLQDAQMALLGYKVDLDQERSRSQELGSEVERLKARLREVDSGKACSPRPMSEVGKTLSETSSICSPQRTPSMSEPMESDIPAVPETSVAEDQESARLRVALQTLEELCAEQEVEQGGQEANSFLGVVDAGGGSVRWVLENLERIRGAMEAAAALLRERRAAGSCATPFSEEHSRRASGPSNTRSSGSPLAWTELTGVSTGLSAAGEAEEASPILDRTSLAGFRQQTPLAKAEPVGELQEEVRRISSICSALLARQKQQDDFLEELLAVRTELGALHRQATPGADATPPPKRVSLPPKKETPLEEKQQQVARLSHSPARSTPRAESTGASPEAPWPPLTKSDSGPLEAFVRSWIMEAMKGTSDSVGLNSCVDPADIVELFQQICRSGGLPQQVLPGNLTPRSCKSKQAAAVEKAVYDVWNSLYPERRVNLARKAELAAAASPKRCIARDAGGEGETGGTPEGKGLLQHPSAIGGS